MRQIDLTSTLSRKKGSRVSYSTVYLHPGAYTGFASSIGVSFLRSLKKGGIVTHSNGTPKWYFGAFQGLSAALSHARKGYGIKLPIRGWEKVQIKAYNTTDTHELMAAINNYKNQAL